MKKKSQKLIDQQIDQLGPYRPMFWKPSRGAPRGNQNAKKENPRRWISATIAPETLAWLEAQKGTKGTIIDRLVAAFKDSRVTSHPAEPEKEDAQK